MRWATAPRFRLISAPKTLTSPDARYHEAEQHSDGRGLAGTVACREARLS